VAQGEATPAFFFDLGTPEAYLTAERILQVVPVAVEWVPVHLPAGADVDRAAVERVAAARGLQAVRWPDPFPFESAHAMRVATYAKQIGRTVAFALAAFRQAYAGGRSLEAADNVLIAASACEMHPAAIVKAAPSRLVGDALARATAGAQAAGVRSTPAVLVPGAGVFHGDAALEDAAAALAARVP